MMKIIKSFGICAVFVCFYFAIALISCAFIENRVLATVVADFVSAGLCFLYYMQKCKVDAVYSVCNRHQQSKLFIVAFFAFMCVAWFFIQITTTFIILHFDDTAYQSYEMLSDSQSYLYMLLTLIAAPIAEEVLLRGVVFNVLKRTIPAQFAYFISSVLFSLMHGTVTHLFLAFTAGFLFAVIYDYTGKLRYPIVFHSVFNFLSITLGSVGLSDMWFNPIVFIPADILILTVLFFTARYVQSLTVDGLKLKQH